MFGLKWSKLRLLDQGLFDAFTNDLDQDKVDFTLLDKAHLVYILVSQSVSQSVQPRLWLTVVQVFSFSVLSSMDRQLNYPSIKQEYIV